MLLRSLFSQHAHLRTHSLGVRVVLSAAWSVMAASCGRSNPAPTGPTSAATGPSISFNIAGSVFDTIQRPVGDVTVSILSGPAAGQQVTTSSDGHFALPQFTASQGAKVTLQLSRDGFGSLTTQLPNTQNAYIRLIPLSLVHLEGAYQMTVTVDAACADFPPPLQSRSYVSVIQQQGTQVTVTLSGAHLQPNYDAFYGTGANDAVRLSVSSKYASDAWLEDDPIIDRLDSVSYVSVDGTATGVVSSLEPSSVTATLDGTVAFCSVAQDPPHADWPLLCAGPLQQCKSTAHQLRLTRR